MTKQSDINDDKIMHNFTVSPITSEQHRYDIRHHSASKYEMNSQ